MSKIVYPENGLYDLVDDSINDCINGLNDAVGRCTYSIPSNFSHLNYVKTLPGLLNGYISDAKAILASAKSCDNDFKFAGESIEAIIKETSVTLIDERDRLVK